MVHRSTITAEKKYLWNYEKITYTKGDPTFTTPVIIGVFGKDGKDGTNGTNGINGKDGKDAAVQGPTAPSDTSYLWLDTSISPPFLKRYNEETESWEVISDTDKLEDSFIYLQEHFSSEFAENEKSILSKVEEKYTLKDDFNEIVESVSTSFEQTAQAIEFKFDSVSKDVEDVSKGTAAQFEEFRKYIKFEDGKIFLGEEGNQIQLVIENEQLVFMQNGVTVAYLKHNKLFVEDGEFTQSLTLGSFVE